MSANSEPKRSTIMVDSNKLPWRPSTFCKGVQVKDLGSSDSYCLQLVKFDPGVIFPVHKHHGPEFIYLLQGKAILYGN